MQSDSAAPRSEMLGMRDATRRSSIASIVVQIASIFVVVSCQPPTENGDVPIRRPGGFAVLDDAPRERREVAMRWIDLAARRLNDAASDVDTHVLTSSLGDGPDNALRFERLEIHESLIAAAARTATISREVSSQEFVAANRLAELANSAQQLSSGLRALRSQGESTGNLDGLMPEADEVDPASLLNLRQLKDAFDYAYEALQVALDESHQANDASMLALIGGRDGLAAQARFGSIFAGRRLLRCLQALDRQESAQICNAPAAELHDYREVLTAPEASAHRQFWQSAFTAEVRTMANAAAPLLRSSTRRLSNTERAHLEHSFARLLAEADQLLGPHLPRRAG